MVVFEDPFLQTRSLPRAFLHVYSAGVCFPVVDEEDRDESDPPVFELCKKQGRE